MNLYTILTDLVLCSVVFADLQNKDDKLKRPQRGLRPAIRVKKDSLLISAVVAGLQEKNENQKRQLREVRSPVRVKKDSLLISAIIAVLQEKNKKQKRQHRDVRSPIRVKKVKNQKAKVHRRNIHIDETGEVVHTPERGWVTCAGFLDLYKDKFCDYEVWMREECCATWFEQCGSECGITTTPATTATTTGPTTPTTTAPCEDETGNVANAPGYGWLTCQTWIEKDKELFCHQKSRSFVEIPCCVTFAKTCESATQPKGEMASGAQRQTPMTSLVTWMSTLAAVIVCWSIQQ